MSRHGIDNQTSCVVAFDREAPLPSYDEAVSGNCDVGFKADVLPPRNSNAQNATADCRVGTSRCSSNGRSHRIPNSQVPNATLDRSSRKKAIFIVLLIFLVPGCIMTMRRQSSVNFYSHRDLQRELDIVNAEYKERVTDLQNLQERYNNLQEKYSRDQYDLNRRIENLEEENSKLRVASSNPSPVTQKSMVSRQTSTLTEKHEGISTVKEPNGEEDLDALIQRAPLVPLGELLKKIDSIPPDKQLQFYERLGKQHV